jgi:two-component system, OmpR family, phosphate regulon sensor histidine kinase PhoR
MLKGCKPNPFRSIFVSMRKSTILFIIVLTSIALVGLMVIQVYWIKNAVTVKEANFVRTVNTAMTGVIEKLDKMEMAFQLKQRTNRNQDVSILQMIDSVNNALASDFAEIKSQDDYQNFLQKSLMAQEILQDILNLNKPRPMEKRINEGLLDSLILLELRQNGVKTEYEFAVYRPRFNSMMLQKTGKYPNELLNKGFVATLYPNDLLPDPHYLMVYFPNEQRFLISQLWDLLLISVLLILMIIFSFVVFLNTIFRQKKLSEMRNDFINNMTHEFKTPISTISLACEALSDKDIHKSEQVYDSYIHIISQENKRLGGMAEKILQTALLNKGRLNLKKEWINIHEIIDDVFDKLDLQIKNRNGRLLKDFNAETSVLFADKIHLTNLISNLVDNANKYSPSDPVIIISTSNNNNNIEIDVKDNGIGIGKADKEKIFEKLYRVPTGNIHNFKGFGLGLSYVKAVAELHGGKVELESELHKGSVFKVILPIEEYK